MKRLLFIGNSHLAAVKAAWQATPQHHQAEFFGTPQRAWLRMTHLPGNAFGLSNDTDAGFARQRKITEQANGKAAVSLADRDVIILIGALSATDPVAPVLATCDIPTLRETAAPTLLSPQLFTAICTTLAQGSAPQPGWHHRPDASVLLLPRPATSETCLGSTNAAFQPWHRLSANPDGALARFAAYDAALGQMLHALGIAYLPQAPETRTNAGLTAATYLAEGGGVTRGEEQRRGDHAHMNPTYGAVCVAQILGWLASQTQN